jgi:N-acetylglucosaminyldiphosphoundecaprenol N-acetyl-beta-D-mannosaminyltransferase
LPDGSGIVLATRILTGKKITKIAGADIHSYLLKEANRKGKKVFYLGALLVKHATSVIPNVVANKKKQ